VHVVFVELGPSKIDVVLEVMLLLQFLSLWIGYSDRRGVADGVRALQ